MCVCVCVCVCACLCEESCECWLLERFSKYELRSHRFSDDPLLTLGKMLLGCTCMEAPASMITVVLDESRDPLLVVIRPATDTTLRD